MTTVLETPRFRLRTMTLADLDFMAEMLGDAEVMRFYPSIVNREDTKLWIEKNQARYATLGFGLWIVEKETGQPLGRVGLIRQHIDGQDEDEIGYMIHRPYWRQGVAHEAACGVRDYALGALGMQRVISLVRPVNIPSQRTALSLGMKPEKLTQHWNMDHIVFALAR